MNEGDVANLRETIAVLKAEGLLDRLRSIEPRGVTFFPAAPPPLSELEQEKAKEEARLSQDAWERRMRTGAAGGIRSTGNVE